MNWKKKTEKELLKAVSYTGYYPVWDWSDKPFGNSLTSFISLFIAHTRFEHISGKPHLLHFSKTTPPLFFTFF
ncbi:hypothetical protein L2E82_27489 [Cichorium intybus]|uniref:Uncharacterized protein n=1 Tax=Cichorium intybus TaxID=13427 RepID=A0ACB9CTA6_CICIN|nr:hypothetical protein L2E82_27489 [Cichorium intybus]